MRGQFRLFASDNIDDGAPNGYNYIWSSVNDQIAIHNTDDNYNKIIYITV